ncbi:hypothetical protein ID866_8228 [Astraeus odoratus]|nr:hypothetical protein ID866_8228 [Astraeus odoratus]
MRLIDVKAVLDMNDGIFNEKTELLKEFNGAKLAKMKYAIVSHCWGDPSEEVEFTEMERLTRMEAITRNEVTKRNGYQKIIKSCGIDKRSSAELSEAINSMYQCKQNMVRFPEFNGWPKWFSRGWTLQELVAPSAVHFFNSHWNYIHDKIALAPTLHTITQIPIEILRNGMPSRWSDRPCVAQIMSWAAYRTTTREEDRAYSLLGLLDVHLPMLYGEGSKAFHRLQLEVIRASNDHSIFAWGHSRTSGWSSSFLADSPKDFHDCSEVKRIEHADYARKFNLARQAEAADKFLEIRAFTITNAGIQICLPVFPCHGSSFFFRAALACKTGAISSQMYITLGLLESATIRHFRSFPVSESKQPQIQQLLLPFRSDETDNRNFVFKFYFNAHASSDMFITRVLLPRPDSSLDHPVLSKTSFDFDSLEHLSNNEPNLSYTILNLSHNKLDLADIELQLSNTNDYAVIYCSRVLYNIHFTIVLVYCCGRHSVHVIDHIDKSDRELESLHMNTLSRAVDSILYPGTQYYCHMHLQNFPWSFGVFHRRAQAPQQECTVMITVFQCAPYCYPGQLQCRNVCCNLFQTEKLFIFLQVTQGPWLPGFVHPSQQWVLHVDSFPVQFLHLSEIKLKVCKNTYKAIESDRNSWVIMVTFNATDFLGLGNLNEKAIFFISLPRKFLTRSSLRSVTKITQRCKMIG